MGTDEMGRRRVDVLASNKYRPRNAGASGTKLAPMDFCVRSSIEILISCQDSFRFG
jgi:hypothetical protein